MNNWMSNRNMHSVCECECGGRGGRTFVARRRKNDGGTDRNVEKDIIFPVAFHRFILRILYDVSTDLNTNGKWTHERSARPECNGMNRNGIQNGIRKTIKIALIQHVILLSGQMLNHISYLELSFMWCIYIFRLTGITNRLLILLKCLKKRLPQHHKMFDYKKRAPPLAYIILLLSHSHSLCPNGHT